MVRGRVVAFALVVVLSACSREAPAASEYPASARFGSGVVLHVKVARTEVQKERGLMGVERLPDDAGMAFVWDEPTDSSFWMKDTRIPLAIAFVDDGGRIETIREMRPCATDPCPLYSADGPFVLAIEANAGWFDRHDVGVGDRVSLEPPE